MKKALAFVLLLFVFTGISAQVCIPDTNIKSSGMYPSVLPDATTGSQYNETVQFKFPKDTMVSGNPITLDSLQIANVEGMPTGFTYQCSNSECMYPGGSNGCVVISGKPSSGQQGDYMVKITVLAKTMYGGAPIWVPFQDSIPFKIGINAGINNFVALSQPLFFSVAGNFPNPFEYFTRIVYTSPSTGNVQFKIFDVIGNMVYSSKYSSEAGENSIYFDRTGIKSGLYLYSIQSGDIIITRRMVIQDK
jgi:hypothetical protein